MLLCFLFPLLLRVRGNPKLPFSALFPEPVKCTGAKGAGAADARTRTERYLEDARFLWGLLLLLLPLLLLLLRLPYSYFSYHFYCCCCYVQLQQHSQYDAASTPSSSFCCFGYCIIFTRSYSCSSLLHRLDAPSDTLTAMTSTTTVLSTPTAAAPACREMLNARRPEYATAAGR